MQTDSSNYIKLYSEDLGCDWPCYQLASVNGNVAGVWWSSMWFSRESEGSMFLPAFVCVSVCDHDD